MGTSTSHPVGSGGAVCFLARFTGEGYHEAHHKQPRNARRLQMLSVRHKCDRQRAPPDHIPGARTTFSAPSRPHHFSTRGWICTISRSTIHWGGGPRSHPGRSQGCGNRICAICGSRASPQARRGADVARIGGGDTPRRCQTVCARSFCWMS